MKNGDDVLQFISKVGEKNLNYRSFQANPSSLGQSKWELINQVSLYKPQLSSFQPERVAAVSPVVQSDAAGSRQFVETPGSSGAQRRSSQPGEAGGFAHLFRKPEPQQQAADVQPAKRDSLAAFFDRIRS